MKRNIKIQKKWQQNHAILIFDDKFGIDPVSFAALFLTSNHLDDMDLHTKLNFLVDLYTWNYRKKLEADIIKDVQEEFDLTVDAELPLQINALDISSNDIDISMFK